MAANYANHEAAALAAFYLKIPVGHVEAPDGQENQGQGLSPAPSVCFPAAARGGRKHAL